MFGTKMILLDGKKVRESAVATLKNDIRELGVTPSLAIVVVGENERTRAYVAAKRRFAERIGAEVFVYAFPHDTPGDEVARRISELNSDPLTHGIIVQLPLPKPLSAHSLIDLIHPDKDVDGLTAVNLKKLLIGARDGFLPATAKGVVTLLETYRIPIAGKRAVVIGRSLLVGKPLALLLLGKDATVTMCHSKTEHMADIARQADILIVAIGKPRFIGREYVRTNQVVIDVGINTEVQDAYQEEAQGTVLVGDVDFESVSAIAGALTPVPGGVGPMTVLSLYENLIEATRRSLRAPMLEGGL